MLLAGGQAQLASGIRQRLPGSKIGQVHVWGWLNSVKMEVPPADVVLPIVEHLEFRMTPHLLRPDLYPNPTDALPQEIAEQVASGRWPPTALKGIAQTRVATCAHETARLVADRRAYQRRHANDKPEPAADPQIELPLCHDQPSEDA